MTPLEITICVVALFAAYKTDCFRRKFFNE